MARHFDGGRLVIASHNPGKIREIDALLGPLGVTVVSAADLGLPEPEENGTTFSANAEIKARAAANGSGLPALADNSGLAVAALDGAPGILSARWAGPDKDFAVAMRRVEDALSGAPDRRAHFVCALALCWPDGHCEIFEGVVHGHLVWPPRGGRGGSVTIRCSSPSTTTSHSAKWIPSISTASVIAPTPSANWSKAVSRRKFEA